MPGGGNRQPQVILNPVHAFEVLARHPNDRDGQSRPSRLEVLQRDRGPDDVRGTAESRLPQPMADHHR
jgi:hypothetical protein